MKLLSRVRLCNDIDCSLPGSSIQGIFWQEYWSRLPFPSPGDWPNPGIKSRPPALQADALLSEPPGKPKVRDWDSLVIQWLGLGPFTAKSIGSIPGWGAKILQAVWSSQKKKRLGIKQPGDLFPWFLLLSQSIMGPYNGLKAQAWSCLPL